MAFYRFTEMKKNVNLPIAFDSARMWVWRYVLGIGNGAQSEWKCIQKLKKKSCFLNPGTIVTQGSSYYFYAWMDTKENPF